jgi:hypothetical protein
MGIKYNNFARSKLAVGLTSVDTTLSVVGTQGARFPVLGAGDYFYAVLQNSVLQREIIKVTARAGDTFTVVRGQDGTTAQAWVADDSISLRFVAAAINETLGNTVQRTTATGSALLPGGTTAQRDVTPTFGYMRANSTADVVEWWNGATWRSISGAAPGANADITSLNALVSVNGGPLGGFRNLLFNSLFDVNQRGYVSGAATTSANQYTLDRWRVVVSGQSLTFSASGIGNIITAPAGGVEQVIRGYNIRGGSYVLNWTGTATATVNGTARTKGEVFTLPANTNATVRLIGGTASEAQLEFGVVCTATEYLLYADRLRQCKRFFCKSFDGPLGTIPGDNGAVYSQANASASPADLPVSVRFGEEMDRVPDLTLRNPTQAWGNSAWRSSSDALDVGLTLLNANRQGANLRLNGAPAGQWVRGHYTADAEVY